MRTSGFAVLRRPVVAVAIVSMFVTVPMVAPAPAAGSCTAGQRPQVFPENQLQPGMAATGLTTVKGRTPQPFDVQILGVLPNALAPGLDAILVKLSGPLIDQTGGAFYGMSGSPVSINGQLVGAIAYGPVGGYGDQTIAGVTPAAAMTKVLDYPSTTQPAASRTISIPRVRRAAAARTAGLPDSSIPSSLSELLVPVAVSGLDANGLAKLQRVTKRLRLPIVPYRAGSASAASQASSQPLQPGGPVSAVASYGDLTFAGTGTLTAVCGDQNLMFGHGFFFDGATTMGMNAATVLTVVKDPSGLIGPYEVSTVDEGRGTINQDRFEALLGTDGLFPPAVPITAHVANLDLGTTRDGETDFVKRGTGAGDLFAGLAPFSIYAEEIAAFDRVGQGTTSISWELQGTTAAGESWTLARNNIIYSPFDAAYDSVAEILNDAFMLADNPFVPVTFTGLHADATMTQNQVTDTITNVAVATNEHRSFSTSRRVTVTPGDRLRLRVALVPFGQTTPKIIHIVLQVPATARDGGILVVRGGQSQSQVFAQGGGGGLPTPSGAKTFDGLLAQLTGAEHNSDLIVQLQMPGVRATQGKVARMQDAVVVGSKAFVVQVPGQKGGGGGGGGAPTPIVCASKQKPPC